MRGNAKVTISLTGFPSVISLTCDFIIHSQSLAFKQIHCNDDQQRDHYGRAETISSN